MGYVSYLDLDSKAIDRLYIEWFYKQKIEALYELKKIVAPAEFDIVTATEEDYMGENGDFLSKLYRIYCSYNEHYRLFHYEGLNIERCVQLWNYATDLYNSCKVNVGDEYFQIPNMKSKKKYYEIILKAYQELKNYELYIYSDAEELSGVEYIDKEKECILTLCNICKIYHNEIEYIFEELGINVEEVSDNNTEEVSDDSSRIEYYFQKAIDMKYIEKTQTGYKSKFKSKALLAYFLGRVYCYDENGKQNGRKFPETYLDRLFEESRLGKALNQLSLNNNGDGKPIGYEEVDILFE